MWGLVVICLFVVILLWVYFEMVFWLMLSVLVIFDWVNLWLWRFFVRSVWNVGRNVLMMIFLMNFICYY